MICTILKATEMHAEERINRARTNLELEDSDLILVAEVDGNIKEFVQLRYANQQMGTAYEDVAEAAAAYEQHLTQPKPTEKSDAARVLEDVLGVKQEETTNA